MPSMRRDDDGPRLIGVNGNRAGIHEFDSQIRGLSGKRP